MSSLKRNSFCIFSALLFSVGFLFFGEAEKAAPPAVAGVDAFEQLVVLERCLETHLAVHGGPPADVAGLPAVLRFQSIDLIRKLLGSIPQTGNTRSGWKRILIPIRQIRRWRG